MQLKNNHFSLLVEQFGVKSLFLSSVGSVAYLLFVRHLDGILAVANIRGGGEYGLTWHKGRPGTKVNHASAVVASSHAAVCLQLARWGTSRTASTTSSAPQST